MLDNRRDRFSVNCAVDVCFWHLADNPAEPAFVRYWGQSGHRTAAEALNPRLRRRLSQVIRLLVVALSATPRR